jgi:hypothetical protein
VVDGAESARSGPTWTSSPMIFLMMYTFVNFVTIAYIFCSESTSEIVQCFTSLFATSCDFVVITYIFFVKIEGDLLDLIIIYIFLFVSSLWFIWLLASFVEAS